MAVNLANPVKVLICRIKQKIPPDEALHCFICQGNFIFNLHIQLAFCPDSGYCCTLVLKLWSFLKTLKKIL